MKSKKAYYYSIDALVSIVIIFALLLFVKPINRTEDSPLILQQDIIEVLSSLKIEEAENTYAKQLVADGKNSDNLTVLEQIAEFHAKGMPEAKLLAESILAQLNSEENIGIWFNNELIGSSNKSSYESANLVWAASQIVSGIEKPEAGGDLKGYSARAFLTSAGRTKYFYFGGYVGDGNISVNISYQGALKSADLEIATGGDFEIYINNQLSGQYSKSPSEFAPVKYSLSPYLSLFHSGSNILEIRGAGYIAGGFVRVNYHDLEYSQEDSYYRFPGITGAINLYDSFYVPANLNSMEIRLHLNSNYQVFLTIGNITIFKNITNGEETKILANSQLSSILNYASLSRKSIPLRLGLENVSYERNITGMYSDVFSVVELSGSMNQNVPGVGKKVLELVQEGNQVFIISLLNESENRAGLIGYATNAEDISQIHNLSSNITSLNNTIYSWKGGSGACTCCGIDKAVQKFAAESNNSKYRSMIVMGDGKANTACETSDAKFDAIQSACRAYNNSGIRVNVIGFGPTTTIDETTLKAIASCGNGSYYYSNATQLTEVYKKIVEEIISASYYEQTVKISSNIFSRLYPDSYIRLGYEKEALPYGLQITSESEKFGNEISEGNFTVPFDSSPIEAVAISYSGPRWTDKVSIFNGTWEAIFDLSGYNKAYIEIGDPYFIYIPKEKIKKGINKVKITTGISQYNSSSGSAYNKIIYSVLKNISSYSPIKASAFGCGWNIEFFDYTNVTIKIPSDYNGTKTCYYASYKVSFNENDAIDYAVHELLSKSLDLNSDKRADIRIFSDDLAITSNQISGIPFPYDTRVQARVWR